MKKKIEHYIQTWKEKGYSSDIPDEVPKRLSQLLKAPSYKEIAIALLTNDKNLISLGYSPPKSGYYSALKKVEIEQRETKEKQLKLL